jgi:hypothetical protein
MQVELIEMMILRRNPILKYDLGIVLSLKAAHDILEPATPWRYSVGSIRERFF